MMQTPNIADAECLDCDVLVIGGGTAGTMAALTAAQHGASVLILEKAHVRHSGALAMGMDGVNNAVIPGKADPDEYVADVTRANDGIVNQRTVRQTATRGYEMVRRLERYGVKFEKDERGEYAVRKVHRSGSYVLPMPEGKDVKKVLYRVLRERSMRERIRIENRVMPVRVLTQDGRAVGAAGFNTRTGEFVTVTAGAVILATGACGRLGLPASGYLYGTYENPTNAGDGHAMAYHAGAELSGIECFQINPLIKDYNGPACAYVANPFGGYQVNALGERFVDCDYWSGQMMAEVAREVESARGPIYLRTTHLAEGTIRSLEQILHTTERPTRGTFHANRGHDYRTHDVEMHISEIGLCGGHSASGVWVDENGNTTVSGLYAAGDLACVPHNYMIGAFVFGDLAGAHAADRVQAEARPRKELPVDQIAAAHALIYRPLHNDGGPPQPQVEYKLRRFVNDYVAPPKTGRKLAIAVETFERMAGEVAGMGGRTPHELMRCAEVSFILDCAVMAAKSSLVRTESRWGLYHERADLPQRDDEDWLFHLNLRKNDAGRMEFLKRPVAPYLVPVEGLESPSKSEIEYLGAAVDGLDIARAGAAISGPETVIHAPAAGNATDRTTQSRILTVLALGERDFSADLLAPHLGDPDPAVRRAAIDLLTEQAPPEAGPILAGMLDDADQEVRAAASSALLELAEVLAPGEALRDALTNVAANTDPASRGTALHVLRFLNLGDRDHYVTALDDPEAEVRAEAVRALVSIGDAATIASQATDPDRDVRVAVAQALALTSNAGTDAGTGTQAAISALERLATDPEPSVRAAAFDAVTASATHFTPAESLTTKILASATDPAWQVRKAAASALAVAGRNTQVSQAVTTLAHLTQDPNADVRRAAVIALDPYAGEYQEADAALSRAADDTDADVRAYARRSVVPRTQLFF